MVRTIENASAKIMHDVTQLAGHKWNAVTTYETLQVFSLTSQHWHSWWEDAIKLERQLNNTQQSLA